MNKALFIEQINQVIWIECLKMKFKKKNAEVLIADEDPVKIGKDLIESLKEKAILNRRKRIRVCSHHSIEDKIHEMLIVHTKGAYIRPHKHMNKSESFHAIEGNADIILMDDTGKINEVISIGEYQSGNCFYYRLAAPLFHTLKIKSDFFVFHEITNGPFNRKYTIFADWAPEENDMENSSNYAPFLFEEINFFKHKNCHI